MYERFFLGKYMHMSLHQGSRPSHKHSKCSVYTVVEIL